MNARAATTFFAIFASACASKASIDLLDGDTETERLVVVVTVDAGGAAERLSVVSKDAVGLPFEMDRERGFYTFDVDPTTFVDPFGPRHLEASALAIRLVGEPHEEGFGACRTCAVETGRAPQPAYAGDSCPMPRFATSRWWREEEGEVVASVVEPGDELIEQLRRSIRVDVAGPCACTVPDAPAPSNEPITFELIEPSWGLEPFEALDVHPVTGDVAVVSMTKQYLIDGADPTRKLEADVSMPGPIVGVRTSSNAYVIASDTGDLYTAGTALHTMSNEGGRLEVAPLATVDDFAARAISIVGDNVVLAGGRADGAALARCRSGTCAVVDVGCGNGDPFVDIAIGADGTWTAVTKTHVAYGTSATQTPVLVECDDGEDLLGYRDFLMSEIGSVGRRGGRAFLCAHFYDDTEIDSNQTALFTATIEAGGPSGWTRTATTPTERAACGRFFDALGGRVAIDVRDHTYFELGADGRPVTSIRAANWFGANYHRLEALSDDWAIISVAPSGQLQYRQFPSSLQRMPAVRGTRTNILHNGAPVGGYQRFPDIEVRRDRAYLVSNWTDQPLTELRADPWRVEPSELRNVYPPRRPDSLRVMLDVDFDPFDDSLVVSGIVKDDPNAEDRPWLYRVTLDDQIVSQPAPPPEQVADPQQLAALAPDTVVYIARDGRLFSARGDEARVVEPDFDDPFTAEVEAAPLSPNGTTIPYRFWSVTAKDGVGWATGSHGLVLRIVPVPPGSGAHVYAERAVGDHPLGIHYRSHPVCPGYAIVSGVADAFAIVGGHRAEPLDNDVDRGRLLAGRVTRPIGVFEHAGSIWTVYRGREVTRDGVLVGWAPFTPESAEILDGRLVIAGFPSRIAAAALR